MITVTTTTMTARVTTMITTTTKTLASTFFNLVTSYNSFQLPWFQFFWKWEGSRLMTMIKMTTTTMATKVTTIITTTTRKLASTAFNLDG